MSVDPHHLFILRSETLGSCLGIFGAGAGLAAWWNEYAEARQSRLTLGSSKEFPNDCNCTFIFVTPSDALISCPGYGGSKHVAARILESGYRKEAGCLL